MSVNQSFQPLLTIKIKPRFKAKVKAFRIPQFLRPVGLKLHCINWLTTSIKNLSLGIKKSQCKFPQIWEVLNLISKMFRSTNPSIK